MEGGRIWRTGSDGEDMEDRVRWRGHGGQGQMERTWRTGSDGEDMVDSGLKECSRVTTYISSDWLSGSLENEVMQSKLLWGPTH